MRPPSSRIDAQAFRTEWCSMGVVTTWPPCGTVPRMAQVLLSLPPEVKNIWSGVQPRFSATVIRAFSTVCLVCKALR